MSKGDGRGARIKLAAYAIFAAFNVFALVVEFARDDTRWWRVVVCVIVAVGFTVGALDQSRALRAGSTAE